MINTDINTARDPPTEWFEMIDVHFNGKGEGLLIFQKCHFFKSHPYCVNF